ncbi:tyrosine-type recombinase/integrase [Prauserella flavalba]|uniref:Integrase n=1 Tax=Prauserella flavalba TaxID=1477506 RepID=A0A318LT17_9PSEU|nr:tyrosine-type recombinase/integrase [Prauserella flavalba]PXY37863.1 integrase [Prauserella flavalba]
MQTSHDVRIWAVEKIKGKRKTTYRVRWLVAKQRFGESFATVGLADSFRSDLVTASRKGEAFDTDTGLPVSMMRKLATMPWFEFACEYIDMKWPNSSPRYRKSTAESLARITLAMTDNRGSLPDAGSPEGRELRQALMAAFNPTTREAALSGRMAGELSTIARHSRNVNDLEKPDVLRSVLAELETNLDGKRGSTNTVRIRKAALTNSIDYAIEKKLLAGNPLAELKTKRRNYALKEVDPASVVNPMQARMLLEAVGNVGKPGPPLVAFFATMYYAGLRPEEAANLNKTDLAIPEEGWGDLNLSGARPEIAKEWTDSGEASEAGPLKHREENTGRTVPCAPALTEILHNHLTRFGTAPDGRLFRGARDGGRVSSSVYGRVWAAARELVFTEEVQAGPLAKRPYDLRHACVSTWLSGGVEPTRVAKWAGHSLSVLLKVYAKCLDGGEKAARDRAERAMRGY